jgi:hypothetical protein
LILLVPEKESTFIATKPSKVSLDAFITHESPHFSKNMPEPIDPSLARVGTGEAETKPETVVSSEGQVKAAPQNDVPANFVEITLIVEEPSPNEGTTEAENEDDLPADEETEEPEWPPADKSDPYWQRMEELQNKIDTLHEEEQKADAQFRAAVNQGRPHEDLQRKRRELYAKKKLAEEKKIAMRQKPAAIDQEEDEVADDDDSSVEQQSPPEPEFRFSFTVGGIPGKADAFTVMRDLVRVEEKIGAFRFVASEEGIINLFPEYFNSSGNMGFLYKFLLLPEVLRG